MIGVTQVVGGAGVGAQQGIVAATTGFVQAAQIVFAAEGHPARTFAARVLPRRVEEILLCVLIGSQRDHVQHARLGDLRDALDGRLDGRRGDAEMMAQQGIGRFPADTFNRLLGVSIWPLLFDYAPLQHLSHLMRRFVSGEHRIEVAHLAGDGGNGRRPTEKESFAPQHPRSFEHTAQFTQQDTRVFGRQTIADTDHIRIVSDDGVEEAFQVGGRAGEVSLITGIFSHSQKASDTGHMDAVPQATRQYFPCFGMHAHLLVFR
ncbi:MAG: hypothetical protein KatS3mg051_0818 [Anaerolineae bacterium]|nr:MAG: hypothetical protein KatS3mg051_0818 [Anaerolineae bacterium]